MKKWEGLKKSLYGADPSATSGVVVAVRTQPMGVTD